MSVTGAQDLNHMQEQTTPSKAEAGRLDVFRMADLLVAGALATLAGEIDIISYYGSHAQGTATDTSDLDIFYIPADGKHPPVGRFKISSSARFSNSVPAINLFKFVTYVA